MQTVVVAGRVHRRDPQKQKKPHKNGAQNMVGTPAPKTHLLLHKRPKDVTPRTGPDPATNVHRDTRRQTGRDGGGPTGETLYE